MGGGGPQGGHDGGGHGHGAHHAAVDLVPHHEAGGPGDVGSVGAGPGQGVHAVFDRRAQQVVPGRVEVHHVDPVAEAIVGDQPRFVALGPPGVLP